MFFSFFAVKSSTSYLIFLFYWPYRTQEKFVVWLLWLLMITMITMITYVLQLWLLMSYSYMLCIYNYHVTVAILIQCEVIAIVLIFVRTRSFKFKCLLKVSLGGYNDKMRVLLNAILVQIANFEVKPNRFSALKVICGSYFPFIIFLSRI